MISPETLRFYSLFAKQDSSMLTKIAMLSQELEYETDHQIFLEGEVAKTLYLILEGSVVLTMNMGEVGEQNIEELEPLSKGEVIGWSSMVKPHIYKMGAYTNQKSRLIAFDGEKLHELFDNNPEYGYYFFQRLSEVIGARLISKCVQLMSLVV
ncbi:MAG: cyclic nucleotide-binding domain-containing protein [Anaerolineales bacterium]|nr:cyclic nucleotide-binding domain-containing protein [Anaerolineales bacterium]